MKTTEIRILFRAVNNAHENYEKDGIKKARFWSERMHENFKEGNYPFAYEYVARLDLLALKAINKNDPFRLKMWRMFVQDFRRAFSDHEFSRFERLKDLGII